MNDALREGLAIAAVGLPLVFGVLTVIALAVATLRHLDARWQAALAQPADAPPATLMPPPSTESVDPQVLVVISAAVHTALAGRGRVTGVRRLMATDNLQNAWGRQGRLAVHGSHLPARRPANPPRAEST